MRAFDDVRFLKNNKAMIEIILKSTAGYPRTRVFSIEA